MLELLICIKDVEFLPSQAIFSSTFLEIVVEVKPWYPHSLRAVVGGKQVRALC